MIVEPEVVEADLAAGRLRCPACDDPLTRWGFARERQVRMRDGIRSIRPRRVCCQRCAMTHVLLPAWAVPRRRDGAEVIGAALLGKARGMGTSALPRGSGGRPGRSAGAQLRTFASRAEMMSVTARRWTHALVTNARCTALRPDPAALHRKPFPTPCGTL